jgi:3-oxoacyl-[acyl-carrier protein] reductase
LESEIRRQKTMRLRDKVAIVTGGAQGIGKAFITGFGKEGAKVVVADIDLEAATITANKVVENGGKALAVRTDVSILEDTEEMARKTVEHFGKIDILINNAAVFGRVKISKDIPFHELDLDEWDRVIAVNFKGVVLCTRAVFPYMKAQSGGKIINMSSGQFNNGGGGGVRYAHYIATKGAVVGLTRALAREFGNYNINVNCIAPGSTFSEDPKDTAALEMRKRVVESRCIKRVEYPEDIVGTAIFLASSDSDFISGQTIGVDGGIQMN